MKKLIITIIVLLSSAKMSGLETNYKLFDLGLGWGGPYGVMGANISFNPINDANIFLGVGIGPEEYPPTSLGDKSEYKIRWSTGIKYYILPANKDLRPRLTVMYGPNSILTQIMKNETGRIIGTFTAFGYGISVGAGLSWMWFDDKNFGIDGDILYGLTSDSYIPKEELERFFPIESKNPLMFSLGIRYAFNI